MNPEIFREYDIRGRVGADFEAADFRAIGQAYGAMIGEDARVALGHDVRESSPPLAQAFESGLRAAGLEVLRLGEVPTPVVYFAVHQHDLDGGVQITGSHNPVDYNGIKMMRGKHSFYGAAIRELSERLGKSAAAGPGAARDLEIKDAYVEAVCARGTPRRPLKVVVDAGNGCAWELAPRILRAMGCEVVELFCEPDGTFPNHIADPTLPETLVTLRERVLAEGADLGLAFDGDADRLGALDATGRIVWGDQLLALFAREVLESRPGAPVLFEVKCSKGLIEDIEAHGGRPVMTRTGHSIIKEAMKREGSPLAGEMSGHLFFADDWFGFDDGIYAAARLVRLVSRSPSGLAALVDSIPAYHATPEIRVPCADRRKFDAVEQVRRQFAPSHPVSDIDGARIDFARGWGLVRASNTQPVIVVRAEGKTPSDRDDILSRLQQALADAGVDASA